MAAGDCLVIAVDLGTTYSAIAYSWRGKQYTVLYPANGFEHFVPQVKSQIAHTGKDYITGSDVDDSIRSGQVSEESRITLFKLGLDKSDVTAEIRATLSKQIAKLPPAKFDEQDESWRKPVLEDLIAIFLKLLYQKAVEVIKKTEGFHDTVIESAKCVIGVPPCWPLQSTQAMVRAAEKAGISNTQVTTEVEAVVALLVRETNEETLSGPVLVYDVGGGTTVRRCIPKINPLYC